MTTPEHPDGSPDYVDPNWAPPAFLPPNPLGQGYQPGWGDYDQPASPSGSGGWESWSSGVAGEPPRPPGHGITPLPSAGEKTGPFNLPLHPMSLSDVLEASFSVVRGNLKQMLTILAVIEIPLQFVAALATRSSAGGSNFFKSVVTQSHSTNPDGSLGYHFHTHWSALVVASVLALFTPITVGAIAKVVASSYLGTPISTSSALRSALRHWLPLLAASILVHIMEIIGLVLLIVPGLLVIAISVAVAPAVVIDDLGPIRAIRRSWRLLKGRVWPVLGIVIVTSLVFGICASLIGGPFTYGSLLVGSHNAWVMIFVGSVLSAIVSVSLGTTAATLIYFDGRIRTEGLDLELLSRRLHS